MAESNWQGPAIGAGAAFLGSIPQLIEAQRLKRERERLLKEGPGGYTPMEAEQIAAARARAASSQVPGYAQEMEGIAQQQADVLAAGKRGSATSSNLLNLLSRLNMQGQAARRNLAMRGAQTQRQAQSEMASIGMNADARREQRRQLFERQLSAMDAARRQYGYAPFMAPLQGAAMFMPYEGLKFGERKPKPTPESVRFNPETDVQIGDEANVSGVRMAPAKLVPTPEMIGLGGQLNMSEDIGYDPFKFPYGVNPYGSLPKQWKQSKK
jgi:hypothetical protein